MDEISNKKNYLLTLNSNIWKIFIVGIVGLISVPISLNYWKLEKYSIWLLINSVLLFLSVSNLGLNAAASILINKNSNNFEKLNILKKSFLLVLISIVVIFIFFLSVNHFFSSWIKLLGDIPNNLEEETKKACIVLMLFFLINVPFSLITSAITGFHKVYIENYFSIISIIFIFLGLLLNIYINGNLIKFAFITGITSSILSVFRTVYFYFYIYLKIIKTNETHRVDSSYGIDSSYRNIFVTGIRCVAGSVASMVVLNTDNFVISHFLGIEKVTPFAITFKLFILCFNFIYIFNSSIIPLVGKSIGKGDMNYIKELYQRTFYLISWIGGGIWIGSISLFKTFIINWSGVEGYAGLMALFFLGGYSYIFSIVNLNYIMINTFNFIKGMVWIVWLEAIINVVTSIFLSKYFGLGGVALGTFLGTLLSPMILFPIYLKKRSRGLIVMNTRYLIMQMIIILMPSLILGLLIQSYVLNIVINVIVTLIVLLIYTIGTYIIIPYEIKRGINQIWKNSMIYDKLKAALKGKNISH